MGERFYTVFMIAIKKFSEGSRKEGKRGQEKKKKETTQEAS